MALQIPMIRSRWLILSLYCALPATILAAPNAKPLTTVPSVDLRRYAGDWYEIARYPNRFQKECASDVHVRYALQSDGKISVRNECQKPNGKSAIANGTAKIVDPKSNAKLKVTFFWPFYDNYWIIDLDPEYRYAVVGDPDRKSLWILSRSKELDASVYQRILKHVAELGFDTSKLVKTRQSLNTAEAISDVDRFTLAAIQNSR
jgi:apolipoprotein D and lipocalin family protein